MFIDWTCDTCHTETGSSGAIHIPYTAIRTAEADRKAAANSPGNEGFKNWNVKDVLALPNLGLWKVECSPCAGSCEGSYWIDISEVGTVAGCTCLARVRGLGLVGARGRW